jgi:hypothetical protein
MEPKANDNFSKIVKTWQIEQLVGKIMLIVETMGLELNQEQSAKSLIKQSIWVEFNEGIYISPEVQQINAKKNEKDGIYNLTQ